eukprot:CAMPEP_0172751704 /NCGR_PEP_ID=MMETSP1074-20121228/152346_1 /TAXON_ID=2916 /ORGANISM="Ceratium fusus, Strain PA161109" /LENGTH=121 /DNA_ID=CAMNT_0013584101 /DNA_START=307 /DNA_END=672 /DNA_ORIENTATION=-
MTTTTHPRTEALLLQPRPHTSNLPALFQIYMVAKVGEVKVRQLLRCCKIGTHVDCALVVGNHTSYKVDRNVTLKLDCHACMHPHSSCLECGPNGTMLPTAHHRFSATTAATTATMVATTRT